MAVKNHIPKPFITKVLIENGKFDGSKTANFTDLYYKKPDEDDKTASEKQNKLKITAELVLKTLYPLSNPSDVDIFKKVTSLLQNSFLLYKPILQEEVLVDFLLADNKGDFFLNKVPGKALLHTINSTSKANMQDISKFAYYQNNIPILNIPTKVSHFVTYDTSISENPEFLAYIFMVFINSPGFGLSPVGQNSFAAEIIFRNGEIPTQTTYFTIGNTFLEKGAEKPINDDSQQIIADYGKPGELWTGDVHRSIINGAPQYIADSVDSGGPYPYLKINFKNNDKIVDYRIINKLENLFTYNSPKFENFLNQLSQTLYKNLVGRKNTLDDYNQKPAIFSEVDYSITNHVTRFNKPKSLINIWFAIDKLRLLKENSTLGSLLDRFAALDSTMIKYFVDKIDILKVQIKRINKTTGQSTLLLTTTNDDFADDSTAPPTYLGHSTSKGHVFRKLKNINVKNKANYIDYYEFRDGEIDASTYDNNEYTYSISLQYIDPIVVYLFDRLQTTRQILKDLDELLFRTTLKIQDKEILRFARDLNKPYDARVSYQALDDMVDVFNPYYAKFHSKFIKAALQTPNYFTFDMSFDNEIPTSLENGFGIPPEPQEFAGGMGPKLWPDPENLALTMLVLNSNLALEPIKKYKVDFVADEIKNFIRNSVKLSTTNPDLIGYVRNLISLLDNKLYKLLSLYGTKFDSKKSIGFSYRDYLKTEGQVTNKQSSLYVTEYEKTFDKTIKLEKTKNRFDWLNTLNDEKLYNLKTVTNNNYWNKLPANFIKILEAERAIELTNKIGVSYFPYINEETLQIFNMPDRGISKTKTAFDNFMHNFMQKNFQTMINKLTGFHDSKLENISIPEILAIFGVKFDLQPGNWLTAELLEKSAFGIDSSLSGFKKSDNNEFFDDNFSTPYNSLNPPQALPGEYAPSSKTPATGLIIDSGGGSVNNPNFAWQGSPFERYPYIISKSIINLLFSDCMQRQFVGRDLHFGDEPLQLNWEAATKVNFEDSTQHPGYSFSKEDIDNVLLFQIFDTDGKLKIENYQLYILFLSLFGKVYYFQGFDTSAQEKELSPTSFLATQQIKSKKWLPLTKEKIGSLSQEEILYCKVELYEDGSVVDKKFINMFNSYYQYNKYFYITSKPLTNKQTGLINLSGFDTGPTGEGPGANL